MPIAHFSSRTFPSALSENDSLAPSSTDASILPSGDLTEYVSARACAEKASSAAIPSAYIFILMTRKLKKARGICR